MSDPITPLDPAQTAEAEQHAAHEGYVKRDLVAFDQMVNVLADGSPDETISARMGRWATGETGLKREIGTAVSRALNLFQADHGARAIAGDDARAKAVEKIEESSGEIDQAAPAVAAEERK